MRPPECAVCGKDCGEDGVLVYFRQTAEDDAWYRRSEEEGFVGHPPNAEWFCGQHGARAKGLKHLSLAEAWKELDPRT